jgi:23S rRNA pseudouridine1911/1915/1917 synthase
VSPGQHFTWTAPLGQAPTRVDRLLAELVEGVSRETIKRWIQEGLVTVDGQTCRPKDLVRPGSVLVAQAGAAPRTTAEPDPSVVFDVVFEDDELLVVDKPAGLVVHPARGHFTGTLVNGLLARPGFARAPADPRDAAGHLRPGIVHRIDKDTSGLLMVAKTERAREGLKNQLARHAIDRVYLALTVGVPRAGRIETLHGRDPKSRLRFSSRVTEGRHARTDVEVLAVATNREAALVRLVLHTGRTHQIRVHLSQERGTPILADALYGGLGGTEHVREVARALGRQALHASVLGFTHPVSEVPLRFEVGFPADLLRARRDLGLD